MRDFKHNTDNMKIEINKKSFSVNQFKQIYILHNMKCAVLLNNFPSLKSTCICIEVASRMWCVIYLFITDISFSFFFPPLISPSPFCLHLILSITPYSLVDIPHEGCPQIILSTQHAHHHHLLKGRKKKKKGDQNHK